MPSHCNIFKFHHFDKELSQVYTSHTIRRFAIALICIFEPVYIFLYFNQSFSKTLFFFAASSALYGLLVPFGAKLMVKLGLKKAMLLSVPFQFLYYLVLWQINVWGFLFLFAIAFKVLFSLFYWPAYHTDVARFSKREFRGQEVSAGSVVYNIASVISPVLGGLIVYELGFPILFVIVLVLLLTSAIPLFFSGEIKEVYYDSYLKSFKQILSKKKYKDTLAFASYGFDAGVNMFIWPIFMFILAINYEAMGLITSGALLLSLIFALYVGKLIDRLSRARLLKTGSLLTGVSWLLKTFVRTPLDAFLADTIYRFCFTSCGIPFRAIMYDEASENKKELDRYIVLREMAHNLGRGILFVVAGIIFLSITASKMYLVFPFAALLVFFFNLLPDKKVKKTN